MTIIRKSTDYETQEILKHGLQVMAEATAGHVKPRWELVQQLTLEFLSSGGYYLVYVEGDIIKGWICIGTSYDIFQDQPIGVLFELYVLPAFRNQGIGKKLCIEAIKLLERSGFPRIELNVFAGNSAKELYKRLGFREVVTTMTRDSKFI